MKKNYSIKIRVIVFVLVLIWCAGFSFISFYPSSFISPGYPFIKYCYSLVCHQQPAKSFYLNDISFFVCARCNGIYAGALFSSLYLIFIKKKLSISLKLIIVSLIPLLIDVILHNAGIYLYSHIVAFITGLFSGSVVFAYILGSLEKFYFEITGLNEQE